MMMALLDCLKSRTGHQHMGFWHNFRTALIDFDARWVLEKGRFMRLEQPTKSLKSKQVRLLW